MSDAATVIGRVFDGGCDASETKMVGVPGIRILMEAEAFQRIHKSWARLGYPFDSLTPSYATAIGSSAVTPETVTQDDDDPPHGQTAPV